MIKSMLFALLAALVTCNLMADDEATQSARKSAFPHATDYCNPYLLESASELPAATLSSIAELSELAGIKAPQDETEIHIEAIVADVSTDNWPQVEKILGSAKSLNRPKVDDTVLEDLTARKLIKVVARPTLVMRDSASAFLSLTPPDTGRSKTTDETYELQVSAKIQDQLVRTEVLVKVSTGEGPQQRKRSVDTRFNLQSGAYAAVIVPGVPNDRNASKKMYVVFLSPSIHHGKAAVATTERDSPIR
jgi:hypothetical protein